MKADDRILIQPENAPVRQTDLCAAPAVNLHIVPGEDRQVHLPLDPAAIVGLDDADLSRSIGDVGFVLILGPDRANAQSDDEEGEGGATDRFHRRSSPIFRTCFCAAHVPEAHAS